ncbi:MAG: YggS family pyridoxal phosphate-dependent enzyme [Flavobacteriaceae bacterium]|nr:YggS family pyridoxal phosphate-dependent enzyme [Flavobacteriaceae bacterium]NVJ73001.1 YggS family pyridoxal phosphate-dependent enzyme [Flavobacteriaceae bacterium]
MSITSDLNQLLSALPESVTLVAVSKTKPNEAIVEAYQVGQRVFGENKVQELVSKWETLPKDIEWHMIGHLQRNKVKYIAPFVSLIHSVDSVRLLQEIDKQAKKNNRVIDCLLQVHIAQEDTKFGFDEAELVEFINSSYPNELNNVRIRGLMGMATFTSEEDQLRTEFSSLKQIYERQKTAFEDFDILSMGMSGDYQLAIEEGSTMIRVGSAIFGARFYKH